MLINGIKFACNTCVKGHRSSNCNHIERPLFEIRKKGRPVTQCAFCRDLRKTRQIHIKCTCTDKSKNIENTATTCYQCPSTTSTKNHKIGGLVTEEQGLAYSDLIQNSSLNTNLSQDKAIQCTCHEAANKILLSQQQQQQEQFNSLWPQEKITPIAPVGRPRSMTMEEVSPGYGNYSNQLQKSASFRFLGGQTKSPRRKSSTSSSKSSGSRRRSANFSQQQPQYQNVNQEDPMIDMQTFSFNQQTVTDMEKNECAMIAVNNNIPSNSSTTTTVSNTSTPNSNYINQNGFSNYNSKEGYNEDIDLMMNTTDPDELTSLLNNVLDNERRRQLDEDQRKVMTAGSVNMTRSTTSNSFSSSSSSHHTAAASGGFVISQPQHMICGSFTPHSNCSPAIDSQGESVVITITPLSNLFDEEQQKQRQLEMNNKPLTRIVTCYCGNSCICPGCFVHPNNYLQQHQIMQQPFMQISSNSSYYSSDDEDQHYSKYANSNATNYSLL